jgi:hypothetical protein
MTETGNLRFNASSFAVRFRGTNIDKFNKFPRFTGVEADLCRHLILTILTLLGQKSS